MASRKRWLESQGKKAAPQESWQTEWHGIKYQGVMAKALPCSERTFQTPLPQQGSPSSRDEESQCVAVEDRRRWRVALEETARGILRYLEDSEDLESRKCKNRWECLKMQVSRSSKLPGSKGKKRERLLFQVLWQDEGDVCSAMLARCNTQLKGLVELERRCRDTMQEVKLLSERQEVLKGMVEDKIRLPSRTTEKDYDQIFEEMKLEEKETTRGSTNCAGKITIYGEMRMKDIMQEGCKDLEAREGRRNRRTHLISLF